jgi:hypothetical protein
MCTHTHGMVCATVLFWPGMSMGNYMGELSDVRLLSLTQSPAEVRAVKASMPTLCS